MHDRFNHIFGSWDTAKEESMYGMYPPSYGKEPDNSDNLFSEHDGGGLGHGDYGMEFDTRSLAERAEQTKQLAEARLAVEQAQKA